MKKRTYFRNRSGFIFIILLTIAFLQACSSEPSIEDAKQFDISSEPTELFRNKTVRDKTVLQSFAFDNVNEHVYVLQVMAGSQQVGDETVAASWSKRTLQGDLTLTKLDKEGEQLEYMHLKGFGHGVAMGIEIEDDEPFIWMETDAIDDGENGWGSKLVRFPFEDQAVLDSDVDNLDTYELIPDADRTTVNIDQAYGLLTMRYRLDGQINFATFSLDDVKEGDYEPLYTIPQPDDIETFQGFASHGDYLYLLEGNSFENEEDDTGNTYITTINLQNEDVIDKQFIEAGMDLPFREPEGMGISIPDFDNPEDAVLNFGFASQHESYAIKLINIFGFDQMVED